MTINNLTVGDRILFDAIAEKFMQNSDDEYCRGQLALWIIDHSNNEEDMETVGKFAAEEVKRRMENPVKTRIEDFKAFS